MSVKQNKNKKFLSSLLCALLCSSNSNVFSMMERPNIAELYNNRYDDDFDYDDENYEGFPWNTNIDKQAVIKWLPTVLAGFAINKKLFLSNSSILDDISSGFQRVLGYDGVSKLANVLDLSYSEVAEATSFGDRDYIKNNWGNELEALAKDMSDNKGWVTNFGTLSTYWKLAVSVKTDLDLGFGKNTSAVLKKLISNRSHLGTPLVVDKKKNLGTKPLPGGVVFRYQDVDYNPNSAYLVHPFTEEGGFKEDGLSADKNKYYRAKYREPLVGAGSSRKALFSINSAMLQTYHLFYKQKKWDPHLMVGKHNVVDSAPSPIDGSTPNINNDLIYGEKGNGNNNKWGFKIGEYVYVRVPMGWNNDHVFTAADPAIFGDKAPGNTWTAGHNAANVDMGDIPIFDGLDGGSTFVASLNNNQENLGGGKTRISLKQWLNNTLNTDSTHITSRYIAIHI